MSNNSFATPDRPSEIIEHMRAESEERYRTLFDLAPVAVYSCDVSGVIRDYNHRAAELWGRKPERGDTDERFCGSFKLYRPDGSFMPHEQCPMGDVLTGKVPGTHDAEVHIERPRWLADYCHREYCSIEGRPGRNHRRDQLLLRCHRAQEG
jgi:PAS domain-containing protein